MYVCIVLTRESATFLYFNPFKKKLIIFMVNSVKILHILLFLPYERVPFFKIMEFSMVGVFPHTPSLTF